MFIHEDGAYPHLTIHTTQAERNNELIVPEVASEFSAMSATSLKRHKGLFRGENPAANRCCISLQHLELGKLSRTSESIRVLLHS